MWMRNGLEGKGFAHSTARRGHRTVHADLCKGLGFLVPHLRTQRPERQKMDMAGSDGCDWKGDGEKKRGGTPFHRKAVQSSGNQSGFPIFAFPEMCLADRGQGGS